MYGNRYRDISPFYVLSKPSSQLTRALLAHYNTNKKLILSSQVSEYITNWHLLSKVSATTSPIGKIDLETGTFT